MLAKIKSFVGIDFCFKTKKVEKNKKEENKKENKEKKKKTKEENNQLKE
jgi:hypothetical protein